MDLLVSLVSAPPAEAVDARDFARIHAAYRPRILRYLTRLVGPQDAEDLTQLVFVRVSQALPAFRGAARLSTWLYRIAGNAAADWRRHTVRAAALHQRVADGTGTAGGREWGATAPSAHDLLIRRETQQCLRGVIAELPAASRDVLVLRELDGRSNAAIAAALGLSLATVKMRLHRARRQLRAVVAARCALTRDRRQGFGCERKGALQGSGAVYPFSGDGRLHG